jgi:hypothetical protein
MKNPGLILLSLIVITACGSLTKKPVTVGDPVNASAFGYQPIDPLPARILLPHDSMDVKALSNEALMSSLPDETMRLAIGQIDRKGNISYGAAELGYEGSSYIIILDYVKFDTKSLPVQITRDSITYQMIDFRTIDTYEDNSPKPDAILPVYVGVGLRITASITVNEGTVDLGNLFALGIAAESKKVTGTLVIQTLGVSGKAISAIIPMPSQINTTTIQNAVMAMASIKAKLYEEDIELNPRVVGFYNNLGGGRETVHKFITNILAKGIWHYID